MKDEQQIRTALDTYSDMIRRICILHLKNYHDAEDVFQDVFLKYALRDEAFESHAHEKAWLIRVTVNACRDILKSFLKRNVVSLDNLTAEPACLLDEDKAVWDAVLKLPEKYRVVVYMFYYEGYSAVDIAKILHKKENTIYTWLSRAKMQLKSIMGGETNE